MRGMNLSRRDTLVDGIMLALITAERRVTVAHD